MLEGLLVGLYVFVLAMLLGSEIINKVPQMLHTPLMSGSNAISGITLVGAVLIAGQLESPLSTVIGIAAVAFATINVVGGFLVTDRMLQMFRRGPARARPASDGSTPDDGGDRGKAGTGGAGGTAGAAGAGGAGGAP